MNSGTAKVTITEDRFERLRARAGLFLAPVAFAILWFLPCPQLSEAAHRLLAVLGAVVVLWVTEAIPLPVTALLGPSVCVLLGIGQARDVFRSFADPIIFLFLGSFLLAEAMLRHGLNRRVAFHILALPWVGESPRRLLLAFGCITGFISMWLSNTATTAMMFPIGLAILREMARLESRQTGQETDFTQLRYGVGLMLVASFASSVGGLATPVGTPPNLIGLGIIERQIGLKIPFFTWMTFGFPIAVTLLLITILYLGRVCAANAGALAGSIPWIRAEKETLGTISVGERNVLMAFGLTVTLWVLPGLIAVVWGSDHPVFKWFNTHLPEAVVSVLGACLLFLLPTDWKSGQFTLSWREATQIDWGTILLFGGGLALGDLMFSTGLAKWIGEGLAHALDAHSTLGLVMLFAAVATVVSETTSNAASATMVVPVAIAVANAAGVDPVQPALAACLGASMGFMLPVSTPPNAIVYGSGCIPLTKMVRYGLLLDVVGWGVIVVAMWLIVPRVLKVSSALLN